MRDWWAEGFAPWSDGILAVAPLTAAVALNRPPYRMQETRPVLAELAERARADDVVYVYCKAVGAADFYGPRVGLGEWRRGGCHEEAAGYVDEAAAHLYDLSRPGRSSRP